MLHGIYSLLLQLESSCLEALHRMTGGPAAHKRSCPEHCASGSDGRSGIVLSEEPRVLDRLQRGCDLCSTLAALHTRSGQQSLRSRPEESCAGAHNQNMMAQRRAALHHMALSLVSQFSPNKQCSSSCPRPGSIFKVFKVTTLMGASGPFRPAMQVHGSGIALG